MNKPLLLFTLLLIIFIDSMGYFLVIPVFFHIINQPFLIFSTAPTSWQSFMLDMAVPISSLASILANPMIGAWSDRWGRRSVMIGCLFISLLGFFLPFMGLVISSFLLILLGRALTGVASTSQPIAQAAIADCCSGSERALYFSFIASAMAAAMVVGPILGETLSGINLWAPYLFASVLVSMSLLLGFLLLKETAPLTLENFQSPWRILKIFQIRRIRWPMFLFFLTQFSWSLYYLAVPLQLVREYHETMHHANLFLGWLGFWMVFGFLVLYRYALKFFSLKKLVLQSLIVAVLGLLLCFLFKSEIVLWVMIVPVAIVGGFTYPSLLGLISNAVPEEQRGYVMGAASAVLAFAWMLSGFLFLSVLAVWVELPLLLSLSVYIGCVFIVTLSAMRDCSL